LQADSVTIAPKVSGYVAEVYVTDNQAVTAGQPLVRLDRRQYQAVLEQANATIAARKADIERGARNVTLRTVASLAKALNISVGNLFAHVAREPGPANGSPRPRQRRK